MPGLALRVVKELNDQLVNLLRMSTVFFFVRDEAARTGRLVGSGVAADLYGTKVVFTAGHVLRDFANEFGDERVALSVNRHSGSFQIKSHVLRLNSPGGALGPDAGLLVLPDADAATYFNFANLSEVARVTTLRPEIPAVGLECIVAGFPSRTSSVTTSEREATLEVRVTADLLMLVGDMVAADDTHAWLGADVEPVEIASGQPVELGSLNGMSGGGCWSVEIDEDAKELKLALHGVHTATSLPRLRQTPIIHHLRLVAGINETMRDKIARLWPEASL